MEGGRVAHVEGYEITLDEHDLPAGVRATGWTRLPDRQTVIAGDVEGQIRELHASGLLGPINAARFGPLRGGPYDGRLTYVVKPDRLPARLVRAGLDEPDESA